MSSIVLGRFTTDKPTAGSATSRVNLTPNFGSQPLVGVDTIRVRGRHRGHDLTWMSQRSRTDRDTGEIRPFSTRTYDSISVLGRKVPIQAGDRQGGHFTFEVSVPKVLRRTNERAASCQEVGEVVQSIYHAASALVDHDGDWTACEVLRLDLVRGFDSVLDMTATLGRLAAVPGSGGRARKIYTDPKRGHAQTLTVGTRGNALTPRRLLN